MVLKIRVMTLKVRVMTLKVRLLTLTMTRVMTLDWCIPYLQDRTPHHSPHELVCLGGQRSTSCKQYIKSILITLHCISDISDQFYE